MKQVIMMGAMFVAGVAVVGSSFAFMGNQEVKEAIEAQDYATFLEVAPDKILERVTSEADFEALIERKQQMQTLRTDKKAQVEIAVQENDLEVFVAAVEDFHAAKQALRQSDADDVAKKLKTPPTTEQLEERFNNLVDYYNENGELPEHK
jgi:hypothetical protein